MRARLGLVVLAACGRLDFDPRAMDASTSLAVAVSAAQGVTVASLDARIAFAALDPGALHALPEAGGAPGLPLDATIPLPDTSGPLTITFDAIDSRGRELTATASTLITSGQQQSVAVVIGGDLAATCVDGVTDDGESDVDCGGSCPACAAGSGCLVASDCSTGSCVAGACEPVSGPPSWLPIAAMPVGRIGAAAVRSGTVIYIFGGSLTDSMTDYAEVDKYDPARDVWGAAPSLPAPRERIAGALDASGTIYAIGGVVGSTLYSEVDAFEPGQAAWTAAATLPTGRAYIAATTDEGGHVWAFGGGDGVTGITETDELGGTAWTQGTALPAARTNAAAARASNGMLYVIGGRVGAGISPTVIGYVASANAWQTVASLAESRSDLCAAVGGDDRVYAIGGYDGANGLTVVEAARAGAAWVAAASLSMARDSCAATAGPDGRIFAFGGRDTPADGNGTTAAEAYGPVLALGATSGSAGDAVVVNGSNFAASSTVVVAFDGIPVERAAIDAAGNLAAITIHVPALGPGSHIVTATDDRSLYRVSLPFTVE
ncbi:MAG TPA: hypothetical protein VGL61_00750 [Kofleriaceae bacterium]